MFGRKKRGKTFTTHKKSTRIGYKSYNGRRYAYPKSAKAGHNKRGDNRLWANKMKRRFGED